MKDCSTCENRQTCCIDEGNVHMIFPVCKLSEEDRKVCKEEGYSQYVGEGKETIQS
ncbi:MAG: hypothetical protein LIR46_01580 [Bacteroidota bacterium]|nr:hypothetical protein [Bacteroidota bacterium]